MERSRPEGAPGAGAVRPLHTFDPLGANAASSDDDVFELLTAAVFQARFRSDVVARRWPSIRRAFAGFRVPLVAEWGEARVIELLGAPGMIRNPKKIRATLRNARDLRELQRRFGSALAYLDAFDGDEEALVRDVDGWAHYVGAPSIRWFVRTLRRGSPAARR